jgi:hypothetical protein
VARLASEKRLLTKWTTVDQVGGPPSASTIAAGDDNTAMFDVVRELFWWRVTAAPSQFFQNFALLRIAGTAVCGCAFHCLEMHAVMVWLSTLPAFVMLLTREASGASRSSSDTSAVVYLFRHCVRSIDETDLAKYASKPFPSFGVADAMCLPRGLKIYQGVGNHLRSTVGPMPVIIADNVQRNIDSAKALASGFGLDPTTIRVDAAPFTRCTPPSKGDETTLVEQRLKAVPKPANYTAMIATIDAVLGGTSKVTARTPFSDKQAQCTRGGPGVHC